MKPALRIVTDTGEILDEHPEVQQLRDEVAGLQRALRKEIYAHERLRRDKAKLAREHELWPKAKAVFDAWRACTGHTRSRWDADRFWLIEPHLHEDKYGLEVCLRAVAGIAWDHYSCPRKNGTIRHFDEWERVFKDAGSLEERASAAPRRWREASMFAPVLERWSK